MDRKFEGWLGRCGARGSAVLLACVCLALTLGLAASFASSAPSFATAKSYATGGQPESVAIGDLNGDSRPDLATANYQAGTVSVLLNSGVGRLQAKVDYGTGGLANSVAIGDLNGDGRPDLATANVVVGDNAVSVLLNRGDGSFPAKRDYSTGRGPRSVATGDLNGDRRPDLVTANASANTVSVLISIGDGTFEARIDYPTGRLPGSVALGDLNGDGKLDLATANSVASAVSVLLSRGDGSFQGKVDYGGSWEPQSVAIGDLNGDGKPDLATDNHRAVTVLLNRGDGSFQAELDYPTGPITSSVAIGDLNGDAKPDLTTTNPSRTASPCSPTQLASAWCRRSRRRRCRPRSARSRGPIAASGRSAVHTRRASSGAG
jgi:hypothetical protein